MDRSVTGAIIKKLREERGMTQLELAEKLNVSEKTVSKWETARGCPDISVLEELAGLLGISVMELFAGKDVSNTNRSFNMLRTGFYVCPVCGNVIAAAGEAVVSCHGVSLFPEEPEEPDEEHTPAVEVVEDEYYVRIPHEMSKAHYISFIAALRDNSVEIVKLYPEGSAECRFKLNRTRDIYYYCSRHGFFKMRIAGKRKKQ